MHSRLNKGRSQAKALNALQRRLLDEYQRDLPLSPTPFKDIAEQLEVSETRVLNELRRLQAKGLLSRVGAVFRPHTVGTSTLAAMAVPAEQLERVARLVSRYPNVNHNYEREHRFNLWFVVTGSDDSELQHTLRQIETQTGHCVMVLPMLEDYFIDLGFRLDWG